MAFSAPVARRPAGRVLLEWAIRFGGTRVVDANLNQLVVAMAVGWCCGGVVVLLVVILLVSLRYLLLGILGV